MKSIVLALAIICSFNATAQVTKINLQASGLTCSMCSNSINKALKTIPYVDKVIANIKTSTFEISFKPGAKINFDDFKAKVEGAGFSVAKLNATMDFKNQQVKNDTHIDFQGLNLHFLNVKNQLLNGSYNVQLLDKGYVSAKEFKKNAAYTSMTCYKTGEMAGERMYHVTI